MFDFSIITVAWNNCSGLMKTWQSLALLAQEKSVTFEWIVVDGDSNDGSKAFLASCEGQYNSKIVSEKDKGIYDAMNKGIKLASGRYALFLNSGDEFLEGIGDIAQKIVRQPVADDNTIYIFDAMLDFGEGSYGMRKAKPGWYIYHSLPASHQATFYPLQRLIKYQYDLSYKVSADYALTAKMFSEGSAFHKINGLGARFSMGGVSTTSSQQLCNDCRRAQMDILRLPTVVVMLSYYFRKFNTWRSKRKFRRISTVA